MLIRGGRFLTVCEKLVHHVEHHVFGAFVGADAVDALGKELGSLIDAFAVIHKDHVHFDAELLCHFELVETVGGKQEIFGHEDEEHFALFDIMATESVDVVVFLIALVIADAVAFLIQSLQKREHHFAVLDGIAGIRKLAVAFV